MGSPFFGLDIALSGLFTSQIQLNTTSHNVANVETDGYTKQVVTTRAADAMETNSKIGMVGTGVTAEDVTQSRNKYYDIKYRRSNGIYGEYEAQSYYLSEIQNYLKELDESGFTTIYNNFYDSLTNLSNDPTDLDKRQNVIQQAETMMDYFNTLYGNLQKVQQDLNSEVRVQVEEINSIANELAELNTQINLYEMGGQTANDLRDQRNVLIDKLSQICDVETEERTINKEGLNYGSKIYVVKINGEVLVETNRVNSLKCVPRDVKENQNDVDGLYDVIWSTTGEKIHLEGTNPTGRLKALIDVRDGNNRENLSGKVTTVKGAKSVVMTGTNINQLSKLDIPEQGTLNIGGSVYRYDGFSIKERRDGSYDYTFNLTEPLRETMYDKYATVGTSKDCKGVPYFQRTINEFLRTYASEFNEIHNSGSDLDGQTGLNFFAYTDAINNTIYSEMPGIYEKDGNKVISSTDISYYKVTGGNIKVNDKIINDPRRIATAAEGSFADGVENKENISKLLALKNDNSMFKQGSPSSFLQSIVSEIGVVTKNALTLSENQKNIVSSISKMRMSECGVDEDEEGMNLIRFQKAYDLAAQVFNVMNEIYRKLINETGV